MKKRLLSLLVCAGMVGSMLTGCGGSGGASGGTQGGTTQAASAQAGTEAGTKGQEASGEAVEGGGIFGHLTGYVVQLGREPGKLLSGQRAYI